MATAIAHGEEEIDADCGHWTWPPRPVCSHCFDENCSFDAVAGTGEIYSWIVVHRSTLPHLLAHAPYPLALVRLDEQSDITIPGRLLGQAAPSRGMRVRAAPVRIDSEAGNLTWETIA